MYSGTLINDLFAIVEKVASAAKAGHADSERLRSTHAELQTNARDCSQHWSEPEKFPQPLGLSPADWNLGLLLVVHAQLVRALEPGNDFANTVDIHQVGAVRPPKKIRV
jgi:hypothetical protein